jgi:rod shape-determining protein MreD
MFQKMDQTARNLFPLGMALLAIVFAATPFYLPGYGAVVPNFALMVAFYWSIYRPDLFPAAAVFAIGLIQDAMMGTPLGLNALVLLGVHGIVVSQRRFFQGKSFTVIWSAFAFVAFGAGLVSWLLAVIFGGGMIGPWPAFFSASLTFALYPIVGWLLARIHHTLLPAGLHASR